jgi:hypothetical protein
MNGEPTGPTTEKPASVEMSPEQKMYAAAYNTITSQVNASLAARGPITSFVYNERPRNVENITDQKIANLQAGIGIVEGIVSDLESNAKSKDGASKEEYVLESIAKKILNSLRTEFQKLINDAELTRLTGIPAANDFMPKNASNEDRFLVTPQSA